MKPCSMRVARHGFDVRTQYCILILQIACTKTQTNDGGQLAGCLAEHLSSYYDKIVYELGCLRTI